ncbi:MAG: FAD-dependent oxidoreductase [Deltaproteobacteria bacterium]|nr:FAD-dependent oxidoreductase [Deltaproteobacteria bacterium]
MQRVETVIVGAGVTGLAAAAAIGKGGDLVVLEKDAEIGGTCKTVKQDGFVWDYSGHFFHFKHREIEAWLRARMPGREVRHITKRAFVSFRGRHIDFPFQKNIHQLPQSDFIDCLHDLYFARAPGMPARLETNLKEMLIARFGASIAMKFLIPFNEKLYATDLATLDKDAMGRFFPHADLSEIVRNMKTPANDGYNATFTYPEGGAIELIHALASEVEPAALHVNEPVLSIDLPSKVVRTPTAEYQFTRLISSAPLPALLGICGVAHDSRLFSWNRVLVFNLGFDKKGPAEPHWLYVGDPARIFYRVGFYDNLFDAPRMSLYVEIGYGKDQPIDVEAARQKVLDDLRAEKIVTDQSLVGEHHVVLDPAYVHLTVPSVNEARRLRGRLAVDGVHSIGRYGAWTYSSIEDNIVEARTLLTTQGVAKAWPWRG